MTSAGQSDLRAKFNDAFIFPFAAYPWKSKRGRSCWIDLEGWSDALAGPIYSVVEQGECAYVYDRDDEYFAGISEPAALRARLRHWHDKLIAGLDRFAPASPDEATDLASMRQFAEAMWVVSEQAIDIERARWESGRQHETATPDTPA
jgi:hypothetical protein